MHPLFQSFFAYAYVCAFAAAIVVLADRRREKRAIGDVLEEQRDWGALRIAGMAGLAGGMLLAWMGRDIVPATWSLPLLLVVAFVQVYRPDFSDRVTGSDGLRYGWYVRRLDELEEWRLTGEHLRFRLFGIWRAVSLSEERHEAYRTRLMELVPDRESAFRE